MDRALMADLMSGVQGGLVRCVLDWFFARSIQQHLATN